MRKLITTLTGMLCLFHIAIAQNYSVSGMVVDSKDGGPIPNATVKIKGAKDATVTDNDGNFTLKSSSQQPSLVISSVGYSTKTLVVSTNSPAKISLDVDLRSLNEVVVTGVGVATSKKKLGIAVESITNDKVPVTPSASVDQFLVGKIAGAQITSINGSPGASVNILLRGINTLNRGTAPMILLDGIEVHATDLNTLDLNTVERVEVVQGAASASIYGAQGANGVIQLFSKKGKQGKINIDIASSVSTNTLLNVGDVHKARFHSLTTNANNEVIGGSGDPVVFDPTLSSYQENVIWNSLDPTNVNNKLYNKNLTYYDHYKMFFRTAYTTNNSVSISGGRDRIDFYISASDNRQNSNFKKNGDYARSNFNSNIGIELFKNLKFRSITQVAYTKSTLNDATGRIIFYQLNNTRSFANYDYKDPDGNFGHYFGDATGVNGENPNYVNQYSSTLDNKIDLVQAFSLNYKFPRFLELDAKYGVNHNNDELIYRYEDQSANQNAAYWEYWTSNYNPNADANSTGEIDNYHYKTTTQNFLATATVRTDFEKDFHLRVPIKTTTQVAYDYRKNLYKDYSTYGLDAPPYTPFTASQLTTYKILTDYTEPFITYGYLINQRFEFGEIAGIAGGFRSDYSSAFGRGSKPFNFPRGDAYLRLSSFNFWNNSKLAEVIPEFKFRAAYGEAGIQPKPFDRYVTLNTRNLGTSNAFAFPTSNPNPDLGVEVSKELEVGTDISFNILKGSWLKSINLSATYWDRKTVNAIYDVDAAPSTGTGTIKNNAFALGSHGIQASLNLNILSNKNFTWNMLTNYSKETSKITSVIGQPVVITSSAGSTNYQLKAGEKIGQLYGFFGLHSVSATKADGTPYIPKADQNLYAVASNGWVVDTATKQPYFTEEQYSFGDPNPKFNMSFINDVSFKNYLNFSMQWDWVYGSHLYNQTKEWMYRDGINGDYDNPITIAGQTGAWSAFYRGVYAQRSRNGTKNYFYEDASFLRLRNISVALDFAKVFSIKGFQRLQLILSGRNLVTFTDYTGYDPEISSGSANSAFDRGVDHNTVPNLKSYQVGLNIGF